MTSLPNSDTSGFKTPSEEEIRRCAYHIYLADNCPEGLELEHWFEAERQLTICALHDAVRSPGE